MNEYLNRETVLKKLDRNSITKKITLSDGVSIYDSIQKLPTADVVEAKAVEQIKWERDMAIKQLESYGVGFGEKADVVKVRHGYWELRPSGHYFRVGSFCSVCGKKSGIGGIRENQLKPYCPNCGAKMDLEGGVSDANV